MVWLTKILPPNRFAAFLTKPALAINQARLEHLGSLGLDLRNKGVLEVGAGIGLLSAFFEKKGCQVLSTDSRPENVAEINRRYPTRQAKVLDLEKNFNPRELGKFDIIFCYGTLYHLSDPGKALRNLAKVGSGVILIETVVNPEKRYSLGVVSERDSVSQSFSGKACRPTRQVVFKLIKKYFGHAYATKTQPNYPDFITTWDNPPEQPLYRAVFVGSKKPLKNHSLLSRLPDKQKIYDQ